MSADAPIVSRPFHPRMCCERCVFGRGEHDLWCLVMPQLPIPADTSEPVCATFAQTYFTATEQQSQAYERMVFARMMKDKTAAVTAAVRIANEGAVPPTASPWEDPWAKWKAAKLPKALIDQVKRGKLIEE